MTSCYPKFAGSTRRTWLRLTTCIFGFSFALCLVAGCGGPSVSDVTGTVQYKGKPVTSGTITMVGTDGQPRQSNIDENGSYKIKNVLTGDVKVLVSSPPFAGAKGGGSARPKQPDRINPLTDKKIETKSEDEPTLSQVQKDTWRAIPPHYGDISQDKLKITLKAGSNIQEIKLD